MEFKTEEEQKRMDVYMKAINQVANEILNPPASKTKGTSTYYIAGRVGNKKFCYTLRKTSYDGRWGFWSWIQTKTKKGWKRTKFAKSGSGQKAKARAERLVKQAEELEKCLNSKL